MLAQTKNKHTQRRSSMTQKTYRIIPQSIPQDKRQAVNEKIMLCVNSGKDLIPRESIYNCYTGDGGLHGLKQEDFPSFHAYTKAKQEAENGQFFTPHALCREMVKMMNPTPDETILDMCCGMGNFFNWLPNHKNAYGFDCDAKAVTVAKHLYPDAHIEKSTMMQYSPQAVFDCIIGNPPFNIRNEDGLSQEQYMHKAYRLLAPAGLMLVIVPISFLKNEFWEKTRITKMNTMFSFIGQCELKKDTFASLGVKSFETKIMAFAKESEHIEMKQYEAEEFITSDDLANRIKNFRENKQAERIKILRETTKMDKEEMERFEYKLKKYLWEFKCQKSLNKNIDKAYELVSRFRNQRPPENCSDKEFKEWEKKKLTPAKVLGILKRQIKGQNKKRKKETALIKTAYGFKLKQYAPNLLEKDRKKYSSINDILNSRDSLPLLPEMTEKDRKSYKTAIKFLKRKKKAMELQNQSFDMMTPDAEISEYLNRTTFLNKEKETCHFTERQKNDLNLVMQKRYALLNWQQGSGKTAASFHWATRLLKMKKVKNAIILAPAIAVNLTWKNFLQINNAQFTETRRPSDLEDIKDGTIVLIPTSMLKPLKKCLMKFVKTRSRKLCLIYDESDEMTNPNSQRTKNSLDIFRRCSHKLLATGTTTRNNIAELYSQIEMLYNNSVNMTCWSDTVYKDEGEDGIEEETNDDYGQPFPAFRGHVLFKKCHCPGKTSVFGIEKQNQDIYNKEVLKELISKTIITRKFKDFAGEKYEIHTHTIHPSPAETTVQEKITKEFHQICHLYYNNTGDTRKEAALRLMRQIKLLIKACSVPNLIEGYTGYDLPSKVEKIADLIDNIEGKVAIGCTSLDAMRMYAKEMTERNPFRPVYVIDGSIAFEKRLKMTQEFDSTINGILICTQQSLSSSANIPRCDDVILESLQWNIPRMEQFYFRFIRLDSENKKRVHMVTYEDSIEQNLTALVMTKERLNDFIKTGEITEQSEIMEEFGVDMSIIESLIKKEYDKEGHLKLTWGRQKAC